MNKIGFKHEKEFGILTLGTMKKGSLYLILLTTALIAGILISFLALRSVNRPTTRTTSLPGFESSPNITPRSTIKPTAPSTSPQPSQSFGGQAGPSATPTPAPSRTPSSNTILFDVPFTPQAPFSEWDNPKLSNGCEEASVYMAMSWVRGTDITPEKARQEMLAISDYEGAKYGVFLDTSAKDTVERIFKGYYGYQKVELRYDISIEDIKDELRRGNLIITPMNGQELHNPYYTQPGPLRHMVVIIGYDPDTREFIANDPGTRNGKKYQYSEQVFFNAIQDYLTGDNLPIPSRRTAMIVIKK